MFHTPNRGGGEAADILLSGRVLSRLVAVVWPTESDAPAVGVTYSNSSIKLAVHRIKDKILHFHFTLLCIN